MENGEHQIHESNRPSKNLGGTKHINGDGRSLSSISRGGELDCETVRKEITSPALQSIAGELIEVINMLRENTIEPDNARLRLTGTKHLIQLFALEKMRLITAMRSETVIEAVSKEAV